MTFETFREQRAPFSYRAWQTSPIVFVFFLRRDGRGYASPKPYVVNRVAIRPSTAKTKVNRFLFLASGPVSAHIFPSRSYLTYPSAPTLCLCTLRNRCPLPPPEAISHLLYPSSFPRRPPRLSIRTTVPMFSYRISFIRRTVFSINTTRSEFNSYFPYTIVRTDCYANNIFINTAEMYKRRVLYRF